MDTLKNSAKILMDPKVSLEKKKESFQRAFGVAKSSFGELTSPGTVTKRSLGSRLKEILKQILMVFLVFFLLGIVALFTPLIYEVLKIVTLKFKEKLK